MQPALEVETDGWVVTDFSKYKKAESYIGSGESQTGIRIDNANYL